MQIRIFVRRPAGLPPSSRSRPIAPPSSVARPTWSISSSRKMSTICLNTLEEPHLVAHLRDRALRERARAMGAVAQPIEHARGIALQSRRALAHRPQRFDHVVRQYSLAVETAPPRGAAFLCDLHHGVGRREPLMYGEDIADLRRARVLAGLARGIGGGRPQLLPDRL